MKPNLFVGPLAVAATALLTGTVGAAPHAHARQHQPAAVKSSRQSIPIKRRRPLGRAYILNAARRGVDPNRGDHMALGRGMHPEQMDHMNAATPVPTAPAPKR